MRTRRSHHGGRGIVTKTIESIARGSSRRLFFLRRHGQPDRLILFLVIRQCLAWRRWSQKVISQQVSRRCWCRARQSPSLVGMKTIFIVVVVGAVGSQIQRGINSLGSTGTRRRCLGGGMDLRNASGNIVGTWLGRGHTHAIFALTLFGGWSRGRSNLLNGRLVLDLE